MGRALRVGIGAIKGWKSLIDAMRAVQPGGDLPQIVQTRGPLPGLAHLLHGWDEHARFMDSLVNDGFIVLAGPLAGDREILHAISAASEEGVRRRLRENFDVTLPRFDLMSQLYRAPKAMPLGELSQRMMVSNGNVTGLVDRLVEQGLINRQPSPKDRRAQLVSLTAEGRRFFRAMARANADWIADMLVDLSSEEIDTLMRLLAKTKASARKAIGNGGPR